MWKFPFNRWKQLQCEETNRSTDMPTKPHMRQFTTKALCETTHLPLIKDHCACLWNRSSQWNQYRLIIWSVQFVDRWKNTLPCFLNSTNVTSGKASYLFLYRFLMRYAVTSSTHYIPYRLPHKVRIYFSPAFLSLCTLDCSIIIVLSPNSVPTSVVGLSTHFLFINSFWQQSKTSAEKFELEAEISDAKQVVTTKWPL